MPKTRNIRDVLATDQNFAYSGRRSLINLLLFSLSKKEAQQKRCAFQ